MNLKKIIHGCRKGRRQAQQQLFMTYSKYLMGIAIRYVKDENSAKDILQESFIRIFSSLQKFEYKNENAFMAWMKRITINEAIRWLKKYNQHFLDVEENSKNNAYTSKKPSILSELYTKDLLTALQTLPQGYQMVFNLYVIEGFSHKEIGELLKISGSTSRSQLSRAKNMLKQLLNITETVYEKSLRQHRTAV